MFAYLRGTLEKKTADSLILDVNGVGYRIFTAASTLGRDFSAGTQVKVYTHFYVREDTQALYGFLTEEELKMFEQLLMVSGVGPKAALALVSAVPPSQFGLAVLTEDADRFVKAPGIGKKTALRIILELKDRLKKEAQEIPRFLTENAEAAQGKDLRPAEAASALIMLGYTPLEANKAVAGVIQQDMTVEEIIRNALKNMGSLF